jgi:RNA polymerase sigma-70 factor (sigma-E family)
MMTTMSAAVTPSAGTEVALAHREHYRSLVRLASVLVDDVGTCEELVQEAFVAVLSTERRFRDRAKLPAYLRSAVLNGARRHLRRRGVRDRPRPLRIVTTERSAEACALLADDHRAVLVALRSLPERQREVLALRYYLDLSETEISETLGIAAGTVKTHAQRGLAALAHTLETRK